MQPANQSITEDIYLQLLQLREKLSVFKTVSCGLMHEQVQELLEDNIADDASPEQLRVSRKGFCTSAMRRNRLGCAHTRANDTFARLADSIYETGILKAAIRPSVMITELIMSIYLMDHEKGMMEKQKALAQYQRNEEEMATIEDALEKIISRHETAIYQLEQLRLDLMHQIDTAINSYR